MMKKYLMMVAMMVVAISATAKVNNDTTVNFKIDPQMVCTNCENKIKNNLRYAKGVTAIEANAPGDVVKVTYNKTKTDSDKIVAEFKKLGYKAKASLSCTNETAGCKKASGCCQKQDAGCCKK